jgi:pimeloyl-ACP methyl ester carboxylesterase
MTDNVPPWINKMTFTINQYKRGGVLYTKFCSPGNTKCIIYFAGRNAFFMYGNMLEAYPDYDVVCLDYDTYGFNKEEGFHKDPYLDSYHTDYHILTPIIGKAIEDLSNDSGYDDIILMGFSTGAFLIMNVLNYYTFKKGHKIRRVAFISPLTKYYPVFDNWYIYPLFKVMEIVSYLGYSISIKSDTFKDGYYHEVIKTSGSIDYNLSSSYLVDKYTKHTSMFVYNVNKFSDKWTKERVNHNNIPIFVAMANASGSGKTDRYYKYDSILNVDVTLEELLKYIPSSNIKAFTSGHDMLLLPITEGKSSYLDVLKHILP